MVLQYFTILLQYVRKARVYNKWVRKERIHNLFAKLVFYNNFYNIHTDALFPVLILLFTIYTHIGIG